MPEIPQISQSLLPPSQTDNHEITQVKPLLQSTIKPRDKDAKPAMTDLPTMLPTSEPSQAQAGFIIPPPQEEIQVQVQVPEVEPPPPSVAPAQAVLPKPKAKPKMKKVQLPSCAGTLNLPVLTSNSPCPPASSRTVKLMNNEVSQLPDPTNISDSISTENKKPFDEIEVEDVALVSKNAGRQDVPIVKLIENEEQLSYLDKFYMGDMPFQYQTATGEARILPMVHPLESRKIVPPPKVSILGTPSEW